MIVKRKGVNYKDARGEILDILCDETVDNVTFVTSKAGSVRGNHYHKQATVHVFVITGAFQVYSRYEGRREETTAQAGTVVTFPPDDLHALVALADSSFIILAAGKRGGDLTVQEQLA